MSDGLFIVGCVFALALLYSATRIAVAVIGQGAAKATVPRDVERRVDTLTAQVDQLQHAVDAAERELRVLAEAQRFAERLTAPRSDAVASRPVSDRTSPDRDPPSNVSLLQSGDLR